MSKDVPDDDLIITPDTGTSLQFEGELDPSALRKQFGENIADDLPMYWAHWEPRSLEAFAKSRSLYIPGPLLYECPISGRVTDNLGQPQKDGFNRGHILPKSLKEVFRQHRFFFKPYIWIDQEANALCGRVFDRTSNAMLRVFFSHKDRAKLETQWLAYADEHRSDVSMSYGFLFSAFLFIFDLYGWEYLASPGGQIVRQILRDALHGKNIPTVKELVTFNSMREVALSSETAVVAFDLQEEDLWFIRVLLPIYYEVKDRRLITVAVLLPGIGEKAVNDFRRVIEKGVPERALAQPRQQVGFGGMCLEPAFREKRGADGSRSLELVHVALCPKPTISHAKGALAAQWRAKITDIITRRIDMQAQYSRLDFPRLDRK